MKYPHNHFQSLLVKNKPNFKNIKDFWHAELRKLFDTVEICPNIPMWMEVVHKGNVSNDLRITSRIKNTCPKGPLSLIDFGQKIELTVAECRFNKFITYPRLFTVIGLSKLKRKVFKIVKDKKIT